jgi:aryl-alcohol dehydrogenase-like predicted oxidoreductase
MRACGTACNDAPMSSGRVIPAAQPTRDLGDGVRMPLLGLGVWQVPNGRETEQAIDAALEAGYRHIDTAAAYRNERSVGAAVRASGLPREDIFVTTKWMPVRPNPVRELAHSLERLGLDYVDLYLIHWPMPFAEARGWRAFEQIKRRAWPVRSVSATSAPIAWRGCWRTPRTRRRSTRSSSAPCTTAASCWSTAPHRASRWRPTARSIAAAPSGTRSLSRWPAGSDGSRRR